MATVGIIASPIAGKDVRRLVANAGSVGDADKVAIIRRAALGAIEGGATRLLLLDDSRHLVLRALDGVHDVDVELIDLATMGTGRDSVRAAAMLAKEDVGAVLVFGGDGTNRDVAKGWIDAPIVPVAVGTNNVFPLHLESTICGVACGLVASGVVGLDEVATRAKVIHVVFEDDEPDLGLVDVVLVEGDFIGSRAVWHTDDLRTAVFAIADPSSVGLSSIGAAVRPTGFVDDAGVLVHMGDGPTVVRAPVGPGTFASVGIADHARLELGAEVIITGPGVLAFDGERDHVLGPGQTARLTIRRDGPWVIDPGDAARLAADSRFFHSPDS